MAMINETIKSYMLYGCIYPTICFFNWKCIRNKKRNCRSFQT